ncbi:DUF1501 domain-containing protein [Brevundimonas sp. NIBR11]|uniref:DUF1501 domain-containing protein n=1 Tax=Brevundimonas sp. NIBR11 TaxID=3015999 RepID=UPI0022F0B4CD|nr:DUF1501 domain-containing protein [Brevundimonas sp. NIBR11]WGM30481.1 hypothetical protein KKHFBJBL_00705 [Brevundimonas sp. NIBR11]
MSHGTHTRRQLLRIGGGLSMLGAAAPFAAQLAAAGSAVGQSAPDYKALVCVFMLGGNDANNMVLATDTDSWNRYFTARNTGADPIALMPAGMAPTPIGATNTLTGRVSAAARPEAWGGVLPIVPRTIQTIPTGSGTRTFGLHPHMGPAKTLFDAGRLAVVANIGTLVRPVTRAQYEARSVALPTNLFSHNDQQSTWQAGRTEGAQTGWGGAFGDLLTGMNGTSALFTAVSTSGNAVFLSGKDVVQYQMSTGAQPAVVINGQAGTSLFGSATAPGRVREIVRDTSAASLFASDYATTTSRSIGAATSLNAAFASPGVTGVLAAPAYRNPITGATETNSLAVQLQTVARMIASAPTLGVKRQVFFVAIGGYDSHDVQNVAQPNNLSKVATALAYFDEALANLGGVNMREAVTTFTASDFSRTFTTNGDGTDHAWGGHHLVMGGAVKGGDIYGQFPTIGMDQTGFKNPDMTSSYFIPTTSVDQYAATMGRWLGVSETNLDLIFPNLKNMVSRGLGFL